MSPELSQQLLGTLSFSPPPTCQQADPDTTSLICYLIFDSPPLPSPPQTHTAADTQPPLNRLFLTVELISSGGKQWQEHMEGDEWLQQVQRWPWADNGSGQEETEGDEWLWHIQRWPQNKS